MGPGPACPPRGVGPSSIPYPLTGSGGTRWPLPPSQQALHVCGTDFSYQGVSSAARVAPELGRCHLSLVGALGRAAWAWGGGDALV